MYLRDFQTSSHRLKISFCSLQVVYFFIVMLPPPTACLLFLSTYLGVELGKYVTARMN